MTPYNGREQIVSGVLGLPLGAGKAIIFDALAGTPRKCFADGRGRIVPFRDPARDRPREMIDLLSNDNERQAMQQANLYLRPEYGMERRVGAQYLKLFREVRRRSALSVRADLINGEVTTPSATHLEPRGPPASDHLHVLSGRYGRCSSTRASPSPDRDHGYCTDDNARALIVAR